MAVVIATVTLVSLDFVNLMGFCAFWQRLNGELPLSADELENVFDSLDSDGNGFLTLEEFSSGFSKFPKLNMTPTCIWPACLWALFYVFVGAFLFGRRISVDDIMTEKNLSKSVPEVLYQSRWKEGPGAAEDDEEKHFVMLMESLGAGSLLEQWVQVQVWMSALRFTNSAEDFSEEDRMFPLSVSCAACQTLVLKSRRPAENE